MSFKKVTTNVIAQIGAKFGTIFITIFLTRILTKYLGDAGFGAYSKIMNFSAIFGVLADIGLYAVTVREISSHKNNHALVQKIAGTVLSIRFLLGVVFSWIAIGIAFFLPGYNTPAMIVAVFLAMMFVLFGLLNSSLLSFLQAELKTEFSFISTITGKLVTFFMILAAVLWIMPVPDGLFAGDMGLIFVLFSTFFGAVVMTAMLWVYSFRFERIWFRWDTATAKMLLAQSVPYAIALFLGSVFLNVDIQLLSYFLSDEKVAHYALSAKLEDVGATMAIFVLNSLLPIMSHAHAQKDIITLKNTIRKGLGTLMAGGFALSVVCWAFAEPILRLTADASFFSGQGFDSIRVFHLTAWIFVLYFVAAFFQFFLLAVRRQKILSFATGAAALANVILNIALIPRMGIFGSAWASIASQLVYIFVLFFLARREQGFYFPKKALAALLGVTVGFVIFGLTMARDFLEHPGFLDLCFGGGILAIVYGAIWWKFVKQDHAHITLPDTLTQKE